MSTIVTRARVAFYRAGGRTPYEVGGQMGIPEFITAKIDDTLRAPVWTQFAGLSMFLSLTDFLGGFDYLRIRRDSYLGKDTIRFEIKNTTDLVSGTRIPLIPDGIGAISLEEYVAHPHAYNRDLTKIADLRRLDTTRFRIRSILSAKGGRSSKSKTGLGGGTMTQLFRWEEPFLRYPHLGGTAIQDYQPRELYPAN